MSSDPADLASRLVRWLQEQVAVAGARGTVVGLSGGVDSAVAAVLCHRAFGDNSLAVILPCRSDPQDEQDALLVVQAFGLPYRTVVLDAVYDLLLQTLEPGGVTNSRDLAAANLKPRLRMLTLYYFANRHNYLVVGTSNLSERTVGYFTKYGDGGVDLMPLGNLVKRQVYELASYLQVPERIIRRPPSAGLWAGQTDEGEMGITYAELDTYLLTGEARPEVKEAVARLSRASEHKRRLPLVAPV